jgi:hypothetical protein
MNIQTPKIVSIERKIRFLIWIFIIGLVLSGLTAFPLEWELFISQEWVVKNLSEGNPFRYWIVKVYEGVHETYLHYPFIGYGTDWLAFAHVIIALNFWGPLKDPVKNIWVIEAGMIACILVIPLALIAGIVREIPFYWRVIDCSFGIFGILPLAYTHQLIRQLKKLKDE